MAIYPCVCVCARTRVCQLEHVSKKLPLFYPGFSFFLKFNFPVRIFTSVPMPVPLSEEQTEVQPLVRVCFHVSERETPGQRRDSAGVRQNELTFFEVHWFINSCMSGVQTFQRWNAVSFFLSLCVFLIYPFFFKLCITVIKTTDGGWMHYSMIFPFIPSLFLLCCLFFPPPESVVDLKCQNLLLFFSWTISFSAQLLSSHSS